MDYELFSPGSFLNESDVSTSSWPSGTGSSTESRDIQASGIVYQYRDLCGDLPGSLGMKDSCTTVDGHEARYLKFLSLSQAWACIIAQHILGHGLGIL